MNYHEKLLDAFHRHPDYRALTTVKVLADCLLQRHLLTPLQIPLCSPEGQQLREQIAHVFWRDYRSSTVPFTGRDTPEAYLTRICQYVALRSDSRRADVTAEAKGEFAVHVGELLDEMSGLAFLSGVPTNDIRGVPLKGHE